jgi:hypothetical protein
VTRRKPVDMSFEDWTERQIREAQERGAFSNLPGAGKPIPDIDKPWSAERWAADLARREGVDLSVALPVPLRLRRDRERLLGGLASLRTEQQVREVVADFNSSVREAFRRPTTGGPPMTGRHDGRGRRAGAVALDAAGSPSRTGPRPPSSRACRGGVGGCPDGAEAPCLRRHEAGADRRTVSGGLAASGGTWSRWA